MLAVFTREFKSLLRNIKAIIAIALFALSSAVLLVVNNLSLGYAGIEAVLSSMSLASAVIIPFVASAVISKDRKTGADELLASMPISKLQIVLGKFFALALFFMIPTAIMAIYPIILVIFGQNGFGASYPAMLMFVLFELAVIALGVMMSAVFKKTWAAMLASYLVLVISFALGVFAIAMPESALVSFIIYIAIAVIIGLAVYLLTKRIPHACISAGAVIAVSAVLYFAFPATLEDSLERVLRFVSPFRHFDPTVFGLFDLSSVFYYLSITVFMLWIALLAMKKKAVKKEKPRKAANAKSSAIVLGATAVLLVVNLTLCSLPKLFTSIDITPGRIYTVSRESKELVGGLEEDITLYLINPMGTEEKVKGFIQRYCSLSNRLSLVEVNTEEDTELASELGVNASTPMYSLVVKSDKRSRFVETENYFSYENPEYGEMTPAQYQYMIAACENALAQASGTTNSQVLQQIQSIQTMYVSLMTETTLNFKIEEAIGSAIEYVTEEYIPTIYFLTGHGEKNTSANPLNISETGSVPEDAGLILINSPETDLSETEIQLLLEYLDGKGRITLLTNEKNLSMTNLKRLMSCYGLSVGDKVLTTASEGVEFEAAVSTDIIPTSASTVKLSGVSEITASDVDGIKAYPFLSVAAPKEKTEADAEENADGEGGEKTEKIETETKTVGMVVLQGSTPKLTWMTGADSFNVSVDDISEDKQVEYVALWNFLQATVNFTKRSFSPSVAYPVAARYSEPMLSLEQGDATWVGVIFIGIVPLSIVGIAYINIFMRKKRSEAIVTE